MELAVQTVLVCGGAGYIGSHIARRLATGGHRVTVLDNLSTGHRAACRWGQFIQADIMDANALFDVFASARYDAVVHVSAKSIVGESCDSPYFYYLQNVAGTLNLLQAMREHGVDRLVFSSSAAIFGNPISTAIDEDHPKQPISPYGASKLMVERILADAARAYGLRSVALRYFNAAGASADGDIGESHSPETHLIPRVLAAATGDGPPLQIFGDDYPTADGTCVRDYVHVEDVAEAHIQALSYSQQRPGAHAFNLGSGGGTSVLEVVRVAEEVSGRRVPRSFSARRAGDPGVLVASNLLARKALGWAPVQSDIQTVLDSAWRWHLRRGF